jgi:hypothetical protein
VPTSFLAHRRSKTSRVDEHPPRERPALQERAFPRALRRAGSASVAHAAPLTAGPKEKAFPSRAFWRVVLDSSSRASSRRAGSLVSYVFRWRAMSWPYPPTPNPAGHFCCHGDAIGVRLFLATALRARPSTRYRSRCLPSSRSLPDSSPPPRADAWRKPLEVLPRGRAVGSAFDAPRMRRTPLRATMPLAVAERWC